jgi:hypothetical protein
MKQERKRIKENSVKETGKHMGEYCGRNKQ